jgi:beta-glucuronidase
MARSRIEIKDTWEFCLDPANRGLKQEWFCGKLPESHPVVVPHTYNVGEGADDYRGPAWYQYRFTAPENWRGCRVRLEFHGIYRDADLWMNGKPAARHYGAGFTTFFVDVSDLVQPGQHNCLTVRVDNSYSPYALPWHNQFDWADDGGIFRPVYWVVTAKTAIRQVRLDPVLHLSGEGERVDHAPVTLGYRVFLCGDAADAEYRYRILGPEGVLAEGNCGAHGKIELPDAKLWHFDAPNLYQAEFSVLQGDTVQDTYSIETGFRSFAVHGDRFFLNGEPVRLAGTEWMPGSDPRIGNAERPQDIARFLGILKNSNCVFTRVHWQQDESFFTWCDRHGMLVQEEIPLWGCPKEPAQNELELAQCQLTEMIDNDYNHPSIISWGVGNELNGQSKVTRKYVEDSIAFCKTLDPLRVESYVSNTPWISPDDATNAGDFMMCNEYIGTWQDLPDADAAVENFRVNNAGKPMVISEFGLCEPTFSGGDPRREDIFLTKMDCYRRRGLAGSIYFCLNDYRTQMGEQGEGRLRQRIHGSTDCYGEPKPSYWTVRRECAPLELVELQREAENQFTATLRARTDLPSYTVKGYVLTLQAGLSQISAEIPVLKPGQSSKISLFLPADGQVQLKVLRPTGECILSSVQ